MNDLTGFLTQSFGEVTFGAVTPGVVFASVLTVLLLWVSGFASGSEIAFFSLSPSDLAELNASKSARDKKIQLLRDDSERTLATILIANNLVNITMVVVLTFAINQVVIFNSDLVNFLVQTVFLTFLLLMVAAFIVGEIAVYLRKAPKAQALKD